MIATDELTSGTLAEIKNQPFNLNPGITIACDDTYLTESTTDENGNQLPAGVYQPVSQWGFSSCVNSTANHIQMSVFFHRYGIP